MTETQASTASSHAAGHVPLKYTKLLLDFKSIPQHKSAKTFMEIAGYPHYENVCSNILQFFLNPHAEHGFGAMFLNALVTLVDDGFVCDTDFETIVVTRELQTVGKKRLDLLIETSGYVIGVENKIFHFLHNDLSDYSETVKAYCASESKKPVNIVLSLNKLTSMNDMEKMAASSFVNVTYDQLFDNIKAYIGRYTTNQNIAYVSYVHDFIKSIENLSPRTMENKALWNFFKENATSIMELNKGFEQYRNSVNQRVYLLQESFPKDEHAPLADKQWVYKNFCLVHDYTIDGMFKISVDTYIDLSGWEIKLFARDAKSNSYLFNTMCRDSKFLPEPLESYERSDRLIYKRFDIDTDISVVAENLKELLSRIESYQLRLSQSKSST